MNITNVTNVAKDLYHDHAHDCDHNCDQDVDQHNGQGRV